MCILFALLIFLFIFKIPVNGIFVPIASVVAETNSFAELPMESQLIVEASVLSPARIKIPRINVDTFVESLGLTQSGAVDVPKGADNVAWFNLSPHPGEVGSAIISGHSGYKNNQPAVFDNLHKLQIGDNIYMEDEAGRVTAFVVRKFQSYGNKENVPEVFNSTDGLSHLNLITCIGDWNPVAKTRSSRLVIFTDKVIE